MYEIGSEAPPVSQYPWVDGFNAAFDLAFYLEYSRGLNTESFLALMGVTNGSRGVVSQRYINSISKRYDDDLTAAYSYVEGAKEAAPVVLEEFGATHV